MRCSGATMRTRRHAPAVRDGRASVRHDQGPHRRNPLLIKILSNVAAETALVLAYNLMRAMNIVGIKPTVAAIVA